MSHACTCTFSEIHVHIINSLTAVVTDQQQIITLPPKKQLGADKQTSCDKQLAVG